ncbi:glycosyltransferase family 15 protein [Dendrothele bispora CBS 962.96]|uniref:Glycosyltransferase family 15 protein n=1 Tax=Dendrothele bispora (strain CBS 962.96) TaxID=1314807 RepID=A0A4S8LP30_DENBC|nr:glycosyltransferase family 15 protein [Dendrothele bispora CBS 962.96]
MAALLPLSPSRRYITAVVALVIGLHYLFSVTFDGYGRVSSLSNITNQLVSTNDTDAKPVVNLDISYYTNYTERRANATFVLLCRNNDLNGVINSMQSAEDRFNRRYNYPWVLLNEEPFTEEFKHRVSLITRAPVHFGLIPHDHWFQPDWIDENKARAGRQKMMAQRIIYAGMSHVFFYRNMCRFNSGFFFHHELLQPYRYYWRPDVRFFCDLDYDPFLYMEDHDKVYSFTISLPEWEPTIKTLWSAVTEFTEAHPEYVQSHNAMDFLSNDGGKTYNLCHFWSNFEIADMDFWRSEAYQAFFNHLESKGGFYYERWGDAASTMKLNPFVAFFSPTKLDIISIAAALFARRDQIHFFRDIGYRHDPFQHCPSGEQWEAGRCACDPKDTFDYHENSCLKKFEGLFS